MNRITLIGGAIGMFVGAWLNREHAELIPAFVANGTLLLILAMAQR